MSTTLLAVVTLGIIFTLANLKNLPLFWHFRLFNILLHRRRWNVASKSNSAKLISGLIFQPLIMTTCSPLLEIDFYMHKNNSTFFSDVDIARSHLIATLLLDTIRGYQDPADVKGKAGMLAVVLGSVSCAFRKEIGPYQRFEIWTRILAWDEKWIYFVSHFVKQGRVKPYYFSLMGQKSAKAEERFELPKDAILASAVSKNIFRQGRTTVAPQKVLMAAGLLPAESTEKKGGSDSAWTWARVEQERLRGLEVAKAMEGMNFAHDVFLDGEGGVPEALAAYEDLWGLV